jgi:ribonucleoside-diphosphate reductase alpha chain
MGFADLLADLDTPYASPAAVSLAEDLMSFVQRQAKAASVELARTRGPFPTFGRSRLIGAPGPLRHACVTSIAPTGTIGLLAGCSSGIEPFFALSYRREVIGSTKTMDVHPALIRRLAAEIRDPEPLLRQVRANGRLPDDAPAGLRRLFATAHEIGPEWHIRMQAAFQRYTDTAVSKTINLANSAQPAEIAAAYRLAFETGCKGVTVFRDGCKDRQVLQAGVPAPGCPECGEPLVAQGGCRNCAACGYSVCTV